MAAFHVVGVDFQLGLGQKLAVPVQQKRLADLIAIGLLRALFDQNLALTAGAPSGQTEMLALDIYNTFYGRTGGEGIGQAKAVIFFIIVALISFMQLRLTRSKEYDS